MNSAVKFFFQSGLLGSIIFAPIASAVLPQAVRPAVGPAGKQLQTAAVVVELRHGSCGPGCSTHVLASEPDIHPISFQIGMYCPDSSQVNYLAFYPGAQEPTVAVEETIDQSSIVETVTVQPFNSDDLVKACRRAYGGEWSRAGIHGFLPATQRTDLEKNIRVSGSCTGWTDDVTRSFPAILTVECHDKASH